MPSTSLLRTSLPATSRSASSPRVSSPLATHSSSIDSQSDQDVAASDSESDDSTNDGSSDSDDDDSDAELGQWLAKAKENARQRAATLAANAESARAGPSITLEDLDLIEENEEYDILSDHPYNAVLQDLHGFLCYSPERTAFQLSSLATPIHPKYSPKM